MDFPEKNAFHFWMAPAVTDSTTDAPGGEIFARKASCDPGQHRADSPELHLQEAAADDLFEVVLEDGSSFFLRVDEAVDELELQSSTRGGADGTVIYSLPGVLPAAEGQQARGSGLKLAALHLWSGVGNLQALESLAAECGVDLAGMAGQGMSAVLGTLLDQAIWCKDPGLKRWDGEQVSPLGKIEKTTGPFLLFLHGTMSSAAGSFADLRQEHPSLWQDLTNAYGEDNILALQHRTLSVSPVENALELLDSLPDKARLHIVSHSRGGMIGELLSLSRKDLDPVPPGQVPDKITELVQLLEQKKVVVERFVRVACPARGTSLLSGRLDLWLNMLRWLVSRSALPLALKALTSLVIAVTKERYQARSFPGLEAISPEGKLVSFLNSRTSRVEEPLSVISGEFKGQGLWEAPAWVIKKVFAGASDLVVDTASMTGGLQRVPENTIIDPFAGPKAVHFRYFFQPDSARAICRSLLPHARPHARPHELPHELPVPATAPAQDRAALRTLSPGEAGGKGIVLILPDLFASSLSVSSGKDSVEIWPPAGDCAELLGENRQNVTGRLLPEVYGEMIDSFTGAGFHVREVWYDWRQSLNDCARSLLDHYTEAQHFVSGHPGTSLNLVVHGRGEWVLRQALLSSPELAGSSCLRVAVLDSNDLSSWQTVEHLDGRSSLAGSLALLQRNPSAVRQWLWSLPLLRLGLPGKALGHVFWQGLKESEERIAARRGDVSAWWRQADLSRLSAVLRQTGKEQETLRKAPPLAGSAGRLWSQGQHLSQIEVGERALRCHYRPRSRSELSTLREVGERVFVNAGGGALRPEDPLVQQALCAFFTSGEMPGLLPLDASPEDATAGQARETTLRSVPLLPLYPDRQAWVSALHNLPEKLLPAEPPVSVTVLHGSAIAACDPVMVGHYLGDTIAGSEQVLDHLLQSALSERRNLGIYPGAPGTADVILRRHAGSPHLYGAIVVGLGDSGALTPGQLEQACTDGLLRYALTRWEDDRQQAALPQENGPTPLQVATVLVGSGEGGLPLQDCVRALIHALQRVRHDLARDPRRPRFTSLQIIEVYEERAAQIWHELSRLQTSSDFRGLFVVSEEVKSGEGGKQSLSAASDPDWWLPLTIVRQDRQKGHGEGDLDTLSFSLSGQATVTQSIQGYHRTIVHLLSQAVQAGTAPGSGLTSPGRVLFETLWPPELKNHSREDRNLKLVLDEISAALPWEMMDDRRGWEKMSSPGDDYPPAARAGIIRQLRSDLSSVPARPRRLQGDQQKALIIGNPLQKDGQPLARDLPPLPQAGKEAEDIAHLLKQKGYQVTLRTEEQATGPEVLGLLMEQDWDILHIAAHGIPHDTTSHAAQTGGVVLDKVVLGPVLWRQMPVPPSLVFLNCCYVGAVGHLSLPDDANNSTAQGWPGVASSLSQQFLNNGVRAVVAAGWPVQDALAREFARTFYSELFENRHSYGAALREARRASYRASPASSTWGAYQCYGDPDWRPTRSSGHRNAAGMPAFRFANAREACAALDDIRNDAKLCSSRNREQLTRRLRHVGQVIDTLPLARDAAVLETRAGVCASLLLLAEAISFYSKAETCEKGRVSVSGLEQKANLQARQALAQTMIETVFSPPAGKVLHSLVGDVREPGQQLKEVENRLQRLIELTGETSERLSLLGSCYKRQAAVQSLHKGKDAGEEARAAKEARNSLQSMKEACERAARLDQGKDYLAIQSLAAALFLNNPPELKDGERHHLDSLRQNSQKKDQKSGRDFWTGVALADASLLLAIDAAMPDDKAIDVGSIAGLYRQAWRREGTFLQLFSVLEQVFFFFSLASGYNKPRLAGSLKSLCQKLGEMSDPDGKSQA